jgi:hypothetical protein
MEIFAKLFLIRNFVQKTDQGADDPALGASLFARLPSLTNHHPALQEHPQQLQNTSIGNFPAKTLKDAVMVQGVKAP